MKTPLLTVAAVQEKLLAHACTINCTESVALVDALNRVLAQDYRANFDMPSHDNSAMDGYAIAITDIQQHQTTSLLISQYIPAGQVPVPLAAQSAARIFTGALLPAGANAVVLQEDCTVDGECVLIPAQVTENQYVRKKGSDFKKDDVLLAKGTCVGATQLGMLATLGIDKVAVYRRLRVAICSTGDELIEPGEPLTPGKLYNSNRFTLRALLQQLGIDVIDLGAVQDDMAQLEQTFIHATEMADCFITSGGASEGDKDFIHALVSKMGEVNAWKVASKPGKPFLFGTLRQNEKHIPFFGLPGNPVSVFVTFVILVKPYLLRCQGLEHVIAPMERISAAFEWKTGQRQEYVRVQKITNANGENYLSIYPSQDSSVFSSLVWASGLAIVPPNTQVHTGDLLEYVPI